jgi:pyridoxamine 5'-phosphate oxidase-like protein
MDREALLEFLRARRLAVVATTAPGGEPQAALVGYRLIGS